MQRCCHMLEDALYWPPLQLLLFEMPPSPSPMQLHSLEDFIASRIVLLGLSQHLPHEFLLRIVNHWLVGEGMDGTGQCA